VGVSYDRNAAEYGLPAGSGTVLGTFRIDGFPEEAAAAARADPSKTPRVRYVGEARSSGPTCCR
jgi:hypothetical protein